MKKILALVIAAGLLTFCAGAVTGTPEVNAPSVLLMEAGTGKVLYEENADKELSIASITKVMTLLLVCEALEAGTVRMDQKVTVSTRASQMGGSQIYLKEGEVMPFEDLLKSVIISSANDSAVALGELVAGSESAFIQRMNNRAKELGMENTCFLNCTGLSAPGHYSSARDVARMSRELLRHDVIRKYSTVWMDSVRNGEFGLTNTNKLVKTYTGITGLKTGFTSDGVSAYQRAPCGTVWSSSPLSWGPRPVLRGSRRRRRCWTSVSRTGLLLTLPRGLRCLTFPSYWAGRIMCGCAFRTRRCCLWRKRGRTG